jgi:hypothetical protein
MEDLHARKPFLKKNFNRAPFQKTFDVFLPVPFTPSFTATFSAKHKDKPQSRFFEI